MNITVSRRSKSHNNINKKGNYSNLIDNQESAQGIKQDLLKIDHDQNKKTVREENAWCTKWFLQKCIKKPSNFQDEFQSEGPLSIEKIIQIEKASRRNISKKAINIECEYKVKLASGKSKSVVNKSKCKINTICNKKTQRQIEKTQILTNIPYLQKETKPLFEEISQFLKPYNNPTIQNKALQNYKSKQMDFSLKPSTVVSSNNNSCHQVKGSTGKKLKLSNNFQSLMETDLKPFAIYSVENKQSQQKSTPYKDLIPQITPRSTDKFQQQISKFQLVYPSQNQFKIQDPYKSSFSINTSYIRKRIQFSSQLSDKVKLENYVYEPIYTFNHLNSMVDQKNLNNYNSELIKNIKIDDEQQFNSPKVHSQQSMVLEKGLEQIFNLSPTFHVVESYEFCQQANQRQVIIENINFDEP